LKRRVILGLLLGVVIIFAWSTFSRLTTAQFEVLQQQHAPYTVLRHIQGRVSLFWLRWTYLLAAAILVACPVLVELGYRLWLRGRAPKGR
jgi:Sec-independent protein secretion pathway component TatC